MTAYKPHISIFKLLPYKIYHKHIKTVFEPSRHLKTAYINPQTTQARHKMTAKKTPFDRFEWLEISNYHIFNPFSTTKFLEGVCVQNEILTDQHLS